MAADPGPSERGGAVRVYVPTTLAAVASAWRTGTVPARDVHAVTPALARWYEGEDVEELELAALTDAAQVSLLLMVAERAPLQDVAPSGEGGGSGRLASRARRVVLAADAPVGPVLPVGPAGPPPTRVPGRATGLSAVRLLADLPWSAVVSAHLDEEDAEPDVAAAVAALTVGDDRPGGPPERAGDDTDDDTDTVAAVEDAEACDLLWYAPSELPGLLEDLART